MEENTCKNHDKCFKNLVLLLTENFTSVKPYNIKFILSIFIY